MVVSLLIGSARGDEFDQLVGEALFSIPSSKQAASHSSLSFRDLEALPPVLRDTRTALVIVSTDQGNLARMLVSVAFRKPLGGKDDALVPVLAVERYETLDAGNRSTRLARGKDVMLFHGFRFDLDTGQVVPEGQGGDLVFTAQTRGLDEATLTATGSARLYTLKEPVPLRVPDPGRPSEGRIVRPTDFAGRFRLAANGQWSGLLILAVDPSGVVSGRFQSDSNGSFYQVSGHVDAEMPQKIAFSVQYPRARQDYHGILWTEGKHVLAGTFSMLERDFSFVAVREGSRLSMTAADADLDVLPSDRPDARAIRVEIEPDRYKLDDAPKSLAELTAALSQALKADPAIEVVLKVPDTTPHGRVRQTVKAIRETGVSSLRLAPATESPP